MGGCKRQDRNVMGDTRQESERREIIQEGAKGQTKWVERAGKLTTRDENLKIAERR
jgi:hypothetical protein